MKRISIYLAGAAMAIIAAGCSTVPDSIIQQPTTPVQQRMATPAPTNGSIFQAAAYRPMFEDRRARMVGDMLTIAINERTSAAKTAANSTSKSGSVDFSAPKLLGIPATTTAKAALAADSSNKFEDKGSASSSNTFSGTIAVTVVDVLPNGNLVVAGEKQVSLDKGVEYVRFSGIVNPDNINANVVSSTLVSDARVEYRTNSRIDKAEMMSQLTRFFLSILPL
ncbi:flagellar basal body L-ring protein FlgH [Noviherbaspirillum denitrificans]|uniref:Flagellar L-ring protein n=1 Tax=Noviherbaspirillum denitrificans TaxID=1968433 RepID=A0A254TAA1_9BURK|nr:flagellar basal body L-ring protein FlgH [Noviherbaspirillum denitrificans]OWW19087.1 flagellar biosynthesis protein FlgH [Noviherbaspirillum denitrificans]